MRTPPIDLSTATGATLVFQQFRDIETGFDDRGSIRVLKAADDTQLGADLVNPTDGTVTDWEEITVDKGRVQQSNFDDYLPLRLDEMPEVEVIALDNEKPIGGIGEPGYPAVGPAILNAVFNLTGKRVRKLPLAGNFNGCGCDTVAIYRPSEARFYIITELGEDGGGLGAADYSFLFGDAGDKPVVGDWDGDGIDEIGLHRESSGFFYYRDTLTTGIADGQFYFGDPDDRFVSGDWGIPDGMETPGLFRPSNRVFYSRHSLTQGNADYEFTWTGAGSTWLPVAGRFDL